jgi:hypothetical protein
MFVERNQSALFTGTSMHLALNLFSVKEAIELPNFSDQEGTFEITI